MRVTKDCIFFALENEGVPLIDFDIRIETSRYFENIPIYNLYLLIAALGMGCIGIITRIRKKRRKN
ncbi:MAG: hypothetical protein ACOC44_12660 [Promethearchaeia archaeon]